jgi:tetratricopeptide (TPR) repeat protein
VSKQKSRKSTKPRKQKAVKASNSKRPLWIALGVIVLATVIGLSPLFNADFVDIDDKKLILDKADMFLNHPDITLLRDFGSPHYKPITYLMWMFEYRLAGPDPFIFHFNNILLHLINTLLVFFLARCIAVKFDRLKGHEVAIACFTAALFGVHPMHVESVGWVVERKDVLYTSFYLLGMLGYIRYLNSQKVLPLILSALAYLLSILSKAPGITLLAILFLLDFIWQRKFTPKLFIEKAGHFAVFGAALWILGILGKGSGEGSMSAILIEKKLARAENISEHSTLYGKFVLAGLRSWLWYLHSWLPVRLSLGYPREQIIGFFGPLIHIFPWLLAVAGGALFWFRKRLPILFFGTAFFFITLAPAIVRLDLGIGIYMSDRYVYLSLFGLIFLFVSWLLSTTSVSWLTARVKTGILVVVCAIAMLASFRMSNVWKNTETLWTNVIEKYPDVDYAWINRASYYRDLGDFDRALTDANKGISINDNANARVQRGLIYRQMGNPQMALEDYNRALSLEADNTQALTNRGNAYLDLRRYREAIEDYREVLEAEPYNVKTRVNYAIAYSSLREFDSAERQFEIAQGYNPDYPDLYLNRAIMCYESGQYAQAIPNYQQYLRFKPDDHQIYNDLGVVYSITGNFSKAVEVLTQAIQLSPVKDYYLLRAQAYDKLGNAAAAAQDRQRAR